MCRTSISPSCIFFTCNVEVNIKSFCARVKDRVLTKLDKSNLIAEDFCGAFGDELEFAD